MGFLRDRQTFLEEVCKGKRIESKIISLMICSTILLAFYGAIVGFSNSWLQALTSAIKLPALYLITLLICLPALFFFEVISGSSRTFGQYLALLLASTSAISIMLFSFAPIALFFHLSLNDYLFFKFLNVAIFTLTGFIGVNFFYRGMVFITEYDARENTSRVKVLADEQPVKENPQRLQIVKIWLILYGFVGSQLGWTLRPFFGTPDQPFSLFRDLESNFYVHVFRMIMQSMGLNH
jgi:hypothetical protein